MCNEHILTTSILFFMNFRLLPTDATTPQKAHNDLLTDSNFIETFIEGV